MSIDVCKRRLFNQLLELKGKKKAAMVLFVDFSSAYDRVDRAKLEILLRQRGILSEEKI